MQTHKQRMLRGELYLDSDPELVAERRHCQRLLDRFNATRSGQQVQRRAILEKLLGGIGVGSWIMPRFQCDYGSLIRLGRNSFLNYDAIVMDCAPVVIGDDVSIGPRAQLLTALHPMHDHEARRQRWETAAPITVGDNAWLGGGVIVCPGVRLHLDVWGSVEELVAAGATVLRRRDAEIAWDVLADPEGNEFCVFTR